MELQSELIIKTLVLAWQAQLNRVSNLLNILSDDQLTQPVAPGKNSGLYLIGHLAAVHDSMRLLLGGDERMYPELEEIFVANPDTSPLPKPSLNELKDVWHTVNTALDQLIGSLSVEEWLRRHHAVSEDDFQREPHRNKLSILLSRTGHLAYHFGQLVLLKNKVSN